MIASVVSIRPAVGHPCDVGLMEIRMVNRLFGADSAGRIVDQQEFQQVETRFAKNLDAVRIHHFLVGLALPLGEAGLEIGIAGDAGPFVLSWSAQHAKDLENLVNLAVSGEQRLARGHLGENAAHAPHVDSSTVLTSPEQDLRSAIPEGDDFMGVGAKRNTKSAGETKVRKLQVAVPVNEEILRLQVAMKHAMGVAVTNAVKELICEFFDLVCKHQQWQGLQLESGMVETHHGFTQPHVTLSAFHHTFRKRLAPAALTYGQSFHVLLEIQVEVLEDQVQLVAVGMDNVQQANNIRIVHFLEQGNLANGRGGDSFILGLQTNFLQGDDALVGSAEVASLVDNTVCACAPSESRTEVQRRAGLPSPIFSSF